MASVGMSWLVVDRESWWLGLVYGSWASYWELVGECHIGS